MNRPSKILIAAAIGASTAGAASAQSFSAGGPATCSRPTTISLADLFWTMLSRTTAGSRLSQPHPLAMRARSQSPSGSVGNKQRT